MSLYAQHGYGKGNKIDKGIATGMLSGVILSPKAETPERIQEYIDKVYKDSPFIDILFDPQFYIGAFTGERAEGKLNRYPYYEPDITRAKLSVPNNLHNYAEKTIKFQRELKLKKLVSPTILFDDFNGTQSQIAVSLAYETVSFSNNNNDLLISLCINENAFRNREAMNEFLDVISLLDVRGFYLIIDRANSNVKESAINGNILTNIMQFCYTLATLNEYEVILGYSDLLSIPLTITGISATACGWHNGSKMFAESNFHPTTGGRRPRKRYTSGKLLNSILLFPEMDTIKNIGYMEQILSETQYDSILTPTFNDVEWTEEASCLHNWNTLSNLIREIEGCVSMSKKLDLVTEKIMKASRLYRLLNNKVPFEVKSGNSHLNIWLLAINDFRNQIGA